MEDSLMMLKNKVIIVTGSTTGIGEAIARRCIAEGAQVLIHGRDQTRAKTLASDLGATAAYHIDDIGDPKTPERIVETAINTFGKIDGLVNNAAFLKRSDLESTDVETFDQVMAINTRAPLLMVRAAIQHLEKTQGSVVGIGSINAYTGESRQLAYAMSKAAHATMSRNLANTFAPKHIRFNHFNVGWVLTENEYKLKMSEGLSKDWPQQMEGTPEVPSGKMTQPSQIAAHAAFWLSDDSRPISGSVVDLEQYPIIGRIPLKEGDHA